jgi:glycosyltransferase involved in cell wall biosynthesis
MAQSLEAGAGVAAAETDARERARGARPHALKILWAAYLDYGRGMEHGGHLRVFNLTRELIRAGHEVHLAVLCRAADDPAARRGYLEELKRKRLVTEYHELEYRHPRVLGKLARLALHPAPVNRILRGARRPTTLALKGIAEREGIDLCIIADRDLLFTLPGVGAAVPTVIDWVDSYVLYRRRELGLYLKGRRLGRAARALRYMLDDFITESYYGRLCDANLAVSPVDKRCLDKVNRAPRKNRVLLNGVNEKAPRPPEPKVRGRIIFTGNMDFPPNYESAVWFIDRVMPLVLERRKDVRLVVAGANPVEELKRRAGPSVEVAGYVDDIGREIAKSELYVAPLVCGGGFKNKVIEAITNGTFVAATSMAVEFLGREAREQLLVADTPAGLADAVLAYLDAPEGYEPRLAALQRLVREEFSWEGRMRELLSLAHAVREGRAKAVS